MGNIYSQGTEQWRKWLTFWINKLKADVEKLADHPEFGNLEFSHENLTDKNSEATVQHVDTKTTKEALDEADKVALYDSESGKVVLTPKSNLQTDLTAVNLEITNLQNEKQDILVSGQNIKTVNGNDITGSGDIVIASTGSAVVRTTGTSETDVMSQKAISEITKSQATQLLKQQDSSLVFKGFAKPGDATPASMLNHAYIVIESGTVFGVAANEGQVLVGDGSVYGVRTMEEKLQKYIEVIYGQFYGQFEIGGISSTTGGNVDTQGGLAYIRTSFIDIQNNETIYFSNISSHFLDAGYICKYLDDAYIGRISLNSVTSDGTFNKIKFLVRTVNNTNTTTNELASANQTIRIPLRIDSLVSSISQKAALHGYDSQIKTLKQVESEIYSSLDNSLDNFPFQRGVVLPEEAKYSGILNVFIADNSLDLTKRYYVQYCGFNSLYNQYFCISAEGQSGTSEFIATIRPDGTLPVLNLEAPLTGLIRLPLYNKSALEVGYVDVDINKAFTGGYYVGTIENSKLRQSVFHKPIQGTSEFSGLKMVALGDSITWGYTPRNILNPGSQLNSFAKTASQKLEMIFENYGISGSFLSCKPTWGEVMFTSQLEFDAYVKDTNKVYGIAASATSIAYYKYDSATSTWINAVAINNPMCQRYIAMADDADVILVMGGTNDVRQGGILGTASDRDVYSYYGALHVLLGGLYKKYMIDHNSLLGKKKKIIVITPIKLLETAPVIEGDNGTLVNWNGWINAIKEVAQYYSFPVLDLHNLSNINPHLNCDHAGTVEGYIGKYYNKYVTDGTHPTQEGHEIMADILVGFLKGLR